MFANAGSSNVNQEKARLRSFVRALGPGLITGAADDDPSGIGTHSQIGAEFGYGLAWTFVLSFPLMVVIQEVAADIGRVTGVGIARNLKRHYRSVLWPMVSLLLIANVVNLGADLSAMGAAMALLIGGNGGLYTLLFGILCIGLEVGLSYPRYASALKWTTLTLFTYVGVVMVAHVPWPHALRSLVVPELQWNAAYATALVAILGTTISPYLFFWQAGQEIEEQRRHHIKPLCITPRRRWARTQAHSYRHSDRHGFQHDRQPRNRVRDRSDTTRQRHSRHRDIAAGR